MTDRQTIRAALKARSTWMRGVGGYRRWQLHVLSAPFEHPDEARRALSYTQFALSPIGALDPGLTGVLGGLVLFGLLRSAGSDSSLVGALPLAWFSAWILIGVPVSRSRARRLARRAEAYLQAPSRAAGDQDHPE